MLSFFATVPIFIAVLLYILPLRNLGKIIAMTMQAVIIYCSFRLLFIVKQGDIVSQIGNFEGTMGIILKADTLSSVFITLASVVFFVVALYSFSDDNKRSFWFFLLIWQGLLNGVFLTCDMFNTFVLIEVVTIVVSVMIMHNRDNRSMRDGMLYLMINTVAIQFFLFGIGYLYKLTGTLDFNAVADIVRELDRDTLLLPFALIMTSVSLKCALVPLFSWLPRAHGTPGAPSAVSAVLSGLHIKIGVYIFIRFQAVFQDVFLYEFFIVIGIITGIAGFVLALVQTDIKLILAYSTISQIGMLIIGLNLRDSYSYLGSIYHIVNHALFKSALFLCAGVISQVYGTRNINKIRGVFKRMPYVGTAMVMAILGITGAPLFNGSVSKYFIMSNADTLMTVFFILINLGTITVFIKYSAMLLGQKEKAAQSICENQSADLVRAQDSRPENETAAVICPMKQISIIFLGFVCLIGGMFGEQFIGFLFNVTVDINTGAYMQKTAIFAVSVIGGFLINRYVVGRAAILDRLRRKEIGFRGICTMLGVYFAALLISGRLMLA